MHGWHPATVPLKCNVVCAHKQLEGSTRVTLLQHTSILNPTRESLRFNTQFPQIQHTGTREFSDSGATSHIQDTFVDNIHSMHTYTL